YCVDAFGCHAMSGVSEVAMIGVVDPFGLQSDAPSMVGLCAGVSGSSNGVLGSAMSGSSSGMEHAKVVVAPYADRSSAVAPGTVTENSALWKMARNIVQGALPLAAG